MVYLVFNSIEYYFKFKIIKLEFKIYENKHSD